VNPMSGPLIFLDSMGPAFGLGFTALTGLCLFQFLQVRELAREGRAAAMEAADARGPEAARGAWERLARLRSRLAASASRANVCAGSVPTLALLGTCLGFFYAILETGNLELGGDPMALLSALMDAGVSTALATTVCGQGIYFLLGQLWAAFVAGPFQEATTLLDEGLALTRDRLSVTPALVTAEVDPTDAPWPGLLRGAS